MSEEVFDRWNFSLVKDLKATTLRDVHADMDPEVIDAFPMTKLEDVCGTEFENITGFGLEHADPTPPPSKYGRHREQGIHIRQN